MLNDCFEWGKKETKNPCNLPVCVLLTKIVWLEQFTVPLDFHTNTAAIHAFIVLFRLKVDVNRQFLWRTLFTTKVTRDIICIVDLYSCMPRV